MAKVNQRRNNDDGTKNRAEKSLQTMNKFKL